MTDTTNLHSTQTEISVIAACIFDLNIYEYVRELLSERLFTDYDCVKAYEVMCQMSDEGLQPDFAEMDARLKKQNVSINKFITGEIFSFEVTRQRVAFLEDLSIRRRMSALFFKGEAMTCDPTITMEDVQTLFKEFDDVLNNSAGAEVQQFGDILKNLMNDVALRKEDKGEMGMMTGLRIFDSRFGWHGGDLIIIAGETSMGKSTLATTIAYNTAVEGIPSAYYSMEMSAKQLTARIIARRVQVSSSTTLYGKLSDDEYNRVYDGSLTMKDLPIYFDEDSKTSFTKICGSIRRMVKKYRVRIVFIDYLQILANGRGDNREQLIGDMARDLKRLAVEMDICIVALSQLARDRNAKEPSMSRMRGSGQIEEACDMAVLIHRPNPRNDEAKIYIAKGRNIGMATEKVRFNSNLSYFCDYEAGDPQAPFEEKKEKLPF